MKHPFSNATEWRMWSMHWCDRCLVDAPFRNTGKGSGCPLIAYAIVHDESPPEWLEQDVAVTDAADLVHCINFRPPGWRNPEPQPQKPPPGQDGLFPADEYRGVRMASRDEQYRHAINAVARHVVLKAVEDAFDFEHVGWEDYPELAEHDWDAVVMKARELAVRQAPNSEYYKAGYEYLQHRAEETL